MQLSAKILKNVSNVNAWEYVAEVSMSEGQSNEFYIQLVDLDRSLDNKSRVATEFPLRYLPIGTSSMQAFFDNLEDSAQFTINGSQPFPQDMSIWKFELSSSQLPSSGNLRFTLVENGQSKTFLIKGGLSIQLLEVGSC